MLLGLKIFISTRNIVQKELRQALFHQAEEIIRANPQYTAVCLEVVPRNENALRLYHKLGYDFVVCLSSIQLSFILQR